MKNTQTQYRQGDVLIERIAEIPVKTTRRIPGAILAQGEATGHHHAIDNAEAVELYEDSSGRDTQAGSVRFMRLTRESVLKHQEHAPIALPPGNYKVTRQREYTPEAVRRVAD